MPRFERRPVRSILVLPCSLTVFCITSTAESVGARSTPGSGAGWRRFLGTMRRLAFVLLMACLLVGASTEPVAADASLRQAGWVGCGRYSNPAKRVAIAEYRASKMTCRAALSVL